MPAAVIGAAATAAFAGATAATFTWAAFGAAFAKAFVINVGLQALGGMLTKSGRQTDQPTVQAEARDRKTTVRSAVEPRRIVYGTARVSGPLVYAETVGSENQQLWMVIPLAGHEVEEIGDLYFGDELVGTLDGSGAVTTGRFAGYASVWKHLGTDAQTADANLLAATAGGWTSAHRLRGVAYVVVKLTWNQNLWTGGIPNIAAVVKGKKLYDPRTGLTVWSNNWALCVRDYLTADYGLGCDSTELDDTDVIAAANIADELVITAAGSPTQTQARYTCNGTVNLADRPIDILQRLLTAGAGVVTYSQGLYHIKAGAYTTPAHDIDESWLRGPVDLQARAPRRDLYNGVRGTFVDPARDYETTDFPPVTNSTYETQDGGVQILRDIELPFTTDGIAAQRIAKIHLEKSRQGITVNLPCNMKAFPVAVWDTVRLSITSLGWSSKVFLVTGWTFNEAGGVDLALQEEASAVYSWSYGDATAIDPAPDTALERTLPPTPTGFTAQQSGPGIVLFSVDQDVLSVAQRVEIRYADAGDTSWTNGLSICNLLKGQTSITQAVPPGTWTFLARSFSLLEDESASVASFSLVVTATGYSTIVSRQEAPDWTGTKTHFIAHPLGALVPDDQHLASYYGWEVFDEFVPTPYATCTYVGGELDKTYDGQARVYLDVVSALGPGETTGQASPSAELDHRLSFTAYDGFDPWTVGSPIFRYCQGQIVLDTSVGVCAITGMHVVVDAQPEQEEGSYTTPAGGSVAVSFENTYYSAPLVQATPQGSGDVTASVASVTTTGFTGYYRSGGAAAAGTANYLARGVVSGTLPAFYLTTESGAHLLTESGDSLTAV